MSAEGDAIDRANRASLWGDCEDRFEIINEELGQIDGLLDDLALYADWETGYWNDTVAALVLKVAAFETAVELRLGIEATR